MELERLFPMSLEDSPLEQKFPFLIWLRAQPRVVDGLCQARKANAYNMAIMHRF